MLPYSLDVYFSVIARMNADLWWAAMLAVLAASLVGLSVFAEPHRWIPRLATLTITAGWLVTGVVFYGGRLEPFFFGADWFLWAYVAQAGLLALAAIALPDALSRASWPGVASGGLVMLVALLVMPGAETILRDGWPGIRLVGLAPEPTVAFTCGWLLTRRPGPAVAVLAFIPLAGIVAAGYSAIALAWPLDWLVVAAGLALLVVPVVMPHPDHSSQDHAP